jgi:hypothetical protein
MQPSEPPRTLTPEERELANKVMRARAVLWVCVLLVAVPVLFVGFRLLTLPDTPDSGFAGMAIMFGMMVWWPVLLIPLIGLVVAMQSKWTAEAKLRNLHVKNRKGATD